MVGLHEVFTVFFITLGPLKIIGPFARSTYGRSPSEVRGIALRTFLIATVAITVGGMAGAGLLDSWGVPVGAVTLAGGIIFMITALQSLLEQYDPRAHDSVVLPAEPGKAAMQLVFPLVVTPYGVAAVIALLGASGSWGRSAAVLGLVLAVMLLDLLAMVFAKNILNGAVMLALRLLGAILGVLQVALAIQFIRAGLASFV